MSTSILTESFQYVFLFFEQVIIMCQKHISQKQRNGRQFMKDTFMVQFFFLLFISFILIGTLNVTYLDSVYQTFSLPPLSKSEPFGIFSKKAKGSGPYDLLSKRLFYSPNNHAGVKDLIDQLVAKYPDVEPDGQATPAEIENEYEKKLFDTWASIEFTLTSDQISTGKLIPSQTSVSDVSYVIKISPTNWSGRLLSSSTYSDEVYNDHGGTEADFFWSSGYLTLQNFVDTYLVQQYDGQEDFDATSILQRYPKSNSYLGDPSVDYAQVRYLFWRWLGGTVLCICLFIPMLSLLTEVVRERQYKMKDLLEISGLMNASYWTSYLVMFLVLGQLAMWMCFLWLSLFSIFNRWRIAPYASLCTCYIISAAAFGLLFGFFIDRCEYYGLPIFALNTILTICGAFMGIAYDMTISAKLFVCFLCPPIALTQGIIGMEDYFRRNSNEMLDYNYVNHDKQYPSMNAINGMMILHFGIVMLIVLGMPFDWLRKKTALNDLLLTINDLSKNDITYPADIQEDDVTAAATSSEDDFLLKVNEISHIYPDGTHAVKDISFKVKKGEVLSFLGANGAGKSTCMGMLSGTLDVTVGDAIVNGYSITRDKVMARRNLGIAMQQDIIWNDVNVEDHLMLFGRLRGLHGTKLREDVSAMAVSLGFPDKKKALAGSLSGGQKRRLCVGLSMVGGNSVVYLDEPTAGLDPVSRRQLWELVEQNRAGRAILLTTHFMDEADVLGDRIAIVKEGRLRALGTSKFLKNNFGLGYLLRMSLLVAADVEKIQERVKSFIPNSSLASHAGTELSMRLPRDSVGLFPELLASFEGSNSRVFGVASYGIETTTLEEVFMRIVNEVDEVKADHESSNKLLGASAEEREVANLKVKESDNKKYPLDEELMASLLVKGSANNPGLTSFHWIPQIWVMLNKRFHQFTRSRGQLSLNLVFPICLFLLLGALVNKIPTTLIGNTPDVNYAQFNQTVNGQRYSLYTSGSSAQSTDTYAEDAFGTDVYTTYTGDTYNDLYVSVDKVAVAEKGIQSTNGIAYGYHHPISNYTVMYNATFPLNFAATMQDTLEYATQNATRNLLNIKQYFGNLPNPLVSNQLNSGFYFEMLISLFAGAIGAAVSIIVSGERVSQVKHQQLASGASHTAYWTANFLFDFTMMWSLILAFGVILVIFRTNSYEGNGFGYVVGPGFFYSIAVIFRFYSISYLVNDVKLAQSVYFYGSLAITFVLVFIFFQSLFQNAHGNANDSGIKIVGSLFTVFDPSFGWAMLILYQNNFLGMRTQNEGKSFLNEIAGSYFDMLLLDAFLYPCIFVFLTEGGAKYLFFRPVQIATNAVSNPMNQKQTKRKVKDLPSERVTGQLDPDVREEKVRVQGIIESGAFDSTNDAIFINELRKVYYAKGSAPAKVAVKDVTISISQGEVFGLLGANGAGKTTLLKMVSGLEQPTSGMALINGYDVVQSTSAAQRSMGLCPQFDTLIERLSVRENLLFFGAIKGLPKDTLEKVVEAYMKALNIKRYESKLIMQLSGGNRRKVSLAVALMGAPPTVYLDEPSTGLDPVASRLMWRLLSRISSLKTTAMVLTTHNMLECEAVCTRICIMKLGEMVCLGDTQHLRSSHGTGFLLEAIVKHVDRCDALIQFVKETFRNAVVVDEQATMINFEIPRASITQLSSAFRIMESNKDRFGIVDYALSQSTLEQVFLKQIRPTASDVFNQLDQQSFDQRIPGFADYFTGYVMLILAIFVPGLHHFYLGNFWRGVWYLITINEIMAGWFLDVFEMHVLIQQSVQQHGNIEGVMFCTCCNFYCYLCCCLCCFTSRKNSKKTTNTAAATAHPSAPSSTDHDLV